MSDRLRPIPFDQLVDWIFSELECKGSIFGIPRELFFTPSAGDRCSTTVFGHRLDNPFGVAAGPHSQMAQNIVVAWLCGARFIELKTVQTLDRLEITKPCIDMRDEGYNVEWSQELRLDESYDEYLRAWVLIHALHRKLGFGGTGPGTVFNTSVGYDLDGIRQPNMQQFLERVREPGQALDVLVETVIRLVPDLEVLEVPASLSDNVTLSTMHGCPPEEIGRIAAYLMRTWGLHTSVKLNPTLLGPEAVRHILHDCLGFDHVVVPEVAFEHDLDHAQAVDLITELEAEASRACVGFAVKLSNTLQVEHRGDVFAPDEASMYLSGRPLHALTVNLAHRLGEELSGRLEMSFAGGADAHNVGRLLACGMSTVTSCSDLLRPGGYTRLPQYISAADDALDRVGAGGLDDYIVRTARGLFGPSVVTAMPEDQRTSQCARLTLGRYAEEVLGDEGLRRDTFDRGHAKTSRALGMFDCIDAPCTTACPIDQDVPQYMRLVEAGRFDEAAAVIREDNPLGAILGRACTHVCELPCVRTHYDEPVAIREIKRFVMDHADTEVSAPSEQRRERVAIIGGGPCGLAAASFLAPAGYRVTVFERHGYQGGMVSGTIPGFRARPAALDQDLRRLAQLGVEVETGRSVSLEEIRGLGFELVVVATGTQRGRRLDIPGVRAEGVLDGLGLLRATRHGPVPTIGRRVGIIGGGDVAIDCARTARRLGAEDVRVLYRRTRAQMPAHAEELDTLLEEGIEIVELVAPHRVEVDEDRVVGLACTRMRLGEPDASGRARPEPIPGSEVEVPLDTVIVAVGQEADLGFLEGSSVAIDESGLVRVDLHTLETSVPGVFAGGDVVRGPATIVEAVGDGKRIAAAIRKHVEGIDPEPATTTRAANPVELLRRRALRERRVPIPHGDPSSRLGFTEVVGTLSEEAATREAARCLSCDEMCSTCVTVCPNRALMTVACAPLQVCMPVLRHTAGGLEPVGEREITIAQELQVMVLTDLCNECGNCSTFCPTSGHPYRDKPRLYLEPGELAAETDNAFSWCRRGPEWQLQARFAGELHELRLGETEARYRSPQLTARLTSDTLEPIEVVPDGRCAEGAEITLEPCAVMLVVLKGLRDAMPELPSTTLTTAVAP